MISIDTTILLYAQNIDCREHRPAHDFVLELSGRDDVVLCELVLVELYVLLRNPSVLENPLTSAEAVETCQRYRRNPRWRLVENAPVMESIWKEAGKHDFPRRRIFDLRLALTLLHHGVSSLATANTKDFQGLGFHKVWNPVSE